VPEHEAEIDDRGDDMRMSESLIETMTNPRNAEQTEEN
jgi:hypothetical protein